MRYAFTTPAGWTRSPFPPPQRGVYLRSPGETPSPERASILLFDAVAPAGSLEDQLAALVRQTCEDAKIGKTGRPSRVQTAGYEGLSVTVNVTVPGDGEPREEVRVLALIEAGSERLPVAFVGGARALAAHQAALDGLLSSIGPLAVARELHAPFAD